MNKKNSISTYKNFNSANFKGRQAKYKREALVTKGNNLTKFK